MQARNEFLAYLGSALTTVVVLFGLQQWYASYLDVHVVHASRRDVPANAKVAAVRAQEHSKLSAGAMPIAEAKQAIAERGRTAFPRIAPKPSEDLSPMSGWMFRKGFAPYQPRYVAPAAPTAEGGGAAGALAVAEQPQPGAAVPAPVEAKP